MRYADLYEHRTIPGEVKHAITHFFAKHISRSVPPSSKFPATSLAKRIVGNIQHDSFYLRNAAMSREKNRYKKLEQILRPQIQGAVKAMVTDHPDWMHFNHHEFVETLIDTVVANVDDLYAALSY